MSASAEIQRLVDDYGQACAARGGASLEEMAHALGTAIPRGALLDAIEAALAAETKLREEAERELLNLVGRHSVTSVEALACGRDGRGRMFEGGCDKPFTSAVDFTRCVDCGAAFHPGCLRKHCEDDLAKERSALTAAEARATRAEGARATAERERDAIRRVLGESLRQMLDRVHAAEAAIRNSGVDYHLRTVRLGLIAAAEAVDADALAGEAQKATAP
jgi:hypothetical protein